MPRGILCLVYKISILIVLSSSTIESTATEISKDPEQNKCTIGMHSFRIELIIENSYITGDLTPFVMKKSLILLCIISWTAISSQHVGIQTLIPDAPLHLWSNGQVYTPGGLLLLGDRANANLELDFNTLQSYFNGNPEPLRLQPNGGNVGINLAFPSAVDFALQVNGQMGINNFLTHVGDTDTYFSFASDDIRLSAGGQENLIVQETDVRIGGNSVFVDTDLDLVGIGTTSPDFTLDVAGDIGIDLKIAHNGDSDTEFRFGDDQVTIEIGNKNFLTMTEGTLSTFIVGQGADMDINLNGFMFIDGGTGRIGMQNTNPGSRLSINADSGEDPLRVGVDGTTEVIVESSGQVGIGDITPSARLEIDSDAAETALRVKVDGTTEMIVASDGQVGIGDSSPSAKLNIDSDAAEDPLRVQLNGSTKLFVNGDGRIGTGSQGYFTPSTDFHLKHASGPSSSATGGLSIENTGSSRWQFWVNDDGNFYLYADGAFQGAFSNGTGDYNPLSDAKAKKNISHLSSVLNRVMQLKPSSYQMKSQSDDAEYQLGFIAQEVKELFPENVRYLKDLDKHIIMYKGMSVLAIKAVQEQQDEIEKLKADNIALLDRIVRLENLLLKE